MSLRFSIYKAHILKQKVSLCGENSDYFPKSCSALQWIHHFINDKFPFREVQQVGCTAFADMEAITAETHVLTLKESKMWKARLNALSPSIDPDSLLHTLVHSGKFEFCEDTCGIVKYLEMVPDEVEG